MYSFIWKKIYTYNKNIYNIFINNNDLSGIECINKIIINNEYELNKYCDLETKSINFKIIKLYH